MTTIKLTEKTRDSLKSLLEAHQTVTEALSLIGKPSFSRAITVNDENNNSFVDVPIEYAIGKRALTEQKAWIEKELSKLGVAV